MGWKDIPQLRNHFASKDRWNGDLQKHIGDVYSGQTRSNLYKPLIRLSGRHQTFSFFLLFVRNINERKKNGCFYRDAIFKLVAWKIALILPEQNDQLY